MNYGTLTIVDNFAKIKDNTSYIVSGKYNNSDFTIAIPLYGFAKYLEETFISIKRALIDNFKVQVLISDSKSSPEDDSKISLLLEKYFKDSYVFLKSRKRMSMYENFNRCVELSHTKYVSMIHNDDLLSDDYFNYCRRIVHELGDNVGMACGRRITFSNKIPKLKKQKFSFYFLKKIDIVLNGISMTGIPSCGIIFNKDIFVKMGGYDDTFNASGDAFLGVKMLLSGYKVTFSNNITGFYRIGDNSSLKLDISQNFVKQDTMFRNDFKLFLPKYLKALFSFYENYFYSKCIDYNINVFGKLNPSINVSNLDYLHKYKHYYKFGFFNASNKIFRKLKNFLHKIFAIKL